MNKSQKDRLVSRTIESKGKKQLDALSKKLMSLADELYSEAIPLSPSDDPEWVHHDSRISLEHTSFFSYRRKDEHTLMDRSLKMSASKPFPQAYKYGKHVRASAKLNKKFDEFVDLVRSFQRDQAKVESDLNALLATVKTYKQLTVAWPEGLELYKDFEPQSASRALVDPSVIDRLNKELVKK